MSPKPDALADRLGRRSEDLLLKVIESHNGCSVNLSDSDSESVADSRRRAPRVGLRGGRFRHYTLAEKLAARLRKIPGGCWEVSGHPSGPNGYIALSIGSPAYPPYVRILAHRFAWEQANGRPVPRGKVVMHTCDNPRCANPAHLRVGTQRENVHDAMRKGRRPSRRTLAVAS